MAAISGVGGAVSVASTGTIYFNSWSIDYNQEAVETSTFGASTRTYVSGMTAWTLTGEGTLDSATAPALPSAAVAVTLTAATNETYTGNVVVTAISPNVNLTGTATVTLTATGTGALSIN